MTDDHFLLDILFDYDTNTAMKKMTPLLPLLLAACAIRTADVGDISSKKIDDVNYEVVIVGKNGVSKQDLHAALAKKSKALCNGPFLPRRNREEVVSLVNGKPASYRVLIEAQCFTAQDLADYDKSVAEAKGGKGSKGSKGAKVAKNSKAKSKPKS